MTVTSPVARNDYTGAGSAGPFVYGFRIYLATDLVVTTQDQSGNVVTLSYPGGYTVTGVGSRSGGTITLTTALAVGWKMTIQRVRPLTQLINYRNQGAGFPANIEDGFDQLVMIAQQLQSELGQAITVPITTGPGSTIASFLPSYYLRVNLAGTGVEGVTNVVAAQNFLQSGAGAVVRSANSKMGEVFSVTDFGATGNGVSDDTAAITAAITASTAAGGGTVFFPRGTYKTLSTIVLPIKTILQGAGYFASVIQVGHDGDGIRSTAPINSSTGKWSAVKDLGITTTRTSNTGGGVVDVGGSFLNYDGLYVNGFAYGIILDQTEICRVDRCIFESGGVNYVAGAWLTNGADHTPGAGVGFTNMITFFGCQFNGNATHTNVIDDGGGLHLFESCNFNAGVRAIRVGQAPAFKMLNCESEGHGTDAVNFLSTTSLLGSYVGPSLNIVIDGCAFSDVVQFPITFNAVQGGRVEGNYFAQYTGTAIANLGDDVTGVVIEGNSKLLRGASRTAGAFLGGSTTRMQNQIYRQIMQTFVATGFVGPAAGVVCTPATMGFPGTSEAIIMGSVLWCINADGTNGEQITVSAVGATTFTATFANTKSANWLVFGAALIP